MVDRKTITGLQHSFPWGFDYAEYLNQSLGREWVKKGESRTHQLAEMLRDARTSIELALSLNETNSFFSSPEVVLAFEENLQVGIPVAIAFDKRGMRVNEPTDSVIGYLNPQLVDLKRKHLPGSLLLLDCHADLKAHFGVVDGTRIMIEDRSYLNEDLPPATFWRSSDKIGQRLSNLFLQIKNSSEAHSVRL